ncbi:MAG: carbohydrate ABC transporter permease [Acholeplasmataceae bacterium]|nr:carbohydrate ABC transporter permease [Acholeplasmataceae bacterium]
MMQSMKNRWSNFNKNLPHYKKIWFGQNENKGLLYKIGLYFLVISFAFVFIYPIFYMFMISLMSNTDLVDSTVMWIPTRPFWDNYRFALRGLGLNEMFIQHVINTFILNQREDINMEIETTKLIVLLLIGPAIVFLGRIYTSKTKNLIIIAVILFAFMMVMPKSYVDSLYVSGTTTFLTVISSAVVGYGLARFDFKGKKLILFLMLIVYILPKTLLFIPLSILYGSLGIKGTMFALWGPAILGQGMQSTFFILIFFQFFRLIPKQIEESARIDGANPFYIFVKIAIPMALPAFVISLTYGFAVNWNELFFTNVYLEGNIKTIPMLLQQLSSVWGSAADYSSGGDFVNIDFTESKAFAGTILSIIPIVVMYGFIQKYFIESIDRSGITGE